MATTVAVAVMFSSSSMWWTVEKAKEVSPEKINDDPYGEGWIVKLNTSEVGDLLSPEEYEKVVEEEA